MRGSVWLLLISSTVVLGVLSQESFPVNSNFIKLARRERDVNFELDMNGEGMIIDKTSDAFKHFQATGKSFTLSMMINALARSHEYFRISFDNTLALSFGKDENSFFIVNGNKSLNLMGAFRFFLVIQYRPNWECHILLYQIDFDTNEVSYPLTLNEELVVGCPQLQFDFTKLKAEFFLGKSIGTVSNVKFFFQDLKLESSTPWIYQSLLFPYPTADKQVHYEFLNGNSNGSYFENPSAFALEVNQTNGTSPFTFPFGSSMLMYSWSDDLMLTVWFNIRKDISKQFGDPDKFQVTILSGDQYNFEGTEKNQTSFEIRAECLREESEYKCTPFFFPLTTNIHYIHKQPFLLGRWTLLKLNAANSVRDQLEETLVHLTLLQADFKDSINYEIKAKLERKNTFITSEVSKIVLGPVNFTGAFKDFRLSNGGFYKFDKDQISNCFIENSASYFNLEPTVPLSFLEYERCVICNQSYYDSDDEKKKELDVYIPQFWDESSCQAFCNIPFFLDYSIRYCRPCTDSQCFSSLIPNSTYSASLFECGNGMTERYYGEECDTGFEEREGCKSCNITDGHVCYEDETGLSKCFMCSTHRCNNWLLEESLDVKHDVQNDCRLRCGFMFKKIQTFEEKFIAYDPKLMKYNCNDHLSQNRTSAELYSDSPFNSSYFPNEISMECQECTIANVNSYQGTFSKSQICSETCGFVWEKSRKYCIEESESNIEFINSARIATIVFLVLIVLLYPFLLIVNKGTYFWIFWEFLIQANVLLYISYNSADVIEAYLLFLNFVTFENLTGKFNIFTFIQSMFPSSNSIINNTNESLYEFTLKVLETPERARIVGRLGYFISDAGFLGMILVPLVALYPAMILVERLTRPRKDKSRMVRFAHWFSRLFSFSIYLRFFMETYVYLSFYAFLQIYSIQIHQLLYDLSDEISLESFNDYYWIFTSYGLAVAVIVVVTCGLPAVVFFISSQIKFSNENEVERYSCLYAGYSRENWFAINFSGIRLVRNALISLAIGFFYWNPMLQCIFLISSQFMVLSIVGVNEITPSRRINGLLLYLTIVIIIVYLISTINALYSYMGNPYSTKQMNDQGAAQICLIVFSMAVAFFVLFKEICNSFPEVKLAFTLADKVAIQEEENNLEDEEKLVNKKKTPLKQLLKVKARRNASA